MGEDSKIWSYVVAFDGGTAPCIDNQKLSLCICKPFIRKYAKIGDWIIGFATKKLGEGHIIYACKITDKVPLEDYFLDTENRSDKVYKVIDGQIIHSGSDIHNSEEYWKRDINGKYCLISNKFWYFGSKPIPAPESLKAIYYPHIGQKTFGAKTDLTNIKIFFENIDFGIYANPKERNGKKTLKNCDK